MERAIASYCLWSARSDEAQLSIASPSVPTSTAFPASTLSGRSVVERMTIAGLPSAVTSSWRPPESVITK